jgi:hypothetical protein
MRRGQLGETLPRLDRNPGASNTWLFLTSGQDIFAHGAGADMETLYGCHGRPVSWPKHATFD